MFCHTGHKNTLVVYDPHPPSPKVVGVALVEYHPDPWVNDGKSCDSPYLPRNGSVSREDTRKLGVHTRVPVPYEPSDPRGC